MGEEEPVEALKVLDSISIQKITPSDLANESTRRVVTEMAINAYPLLTVEKVLKSLSTGFLEAFWILDGSRNPAGVITIQVGVNTDDDGEDVRVLYCATATITPRIGDSGWRYILSYGIRLARVRGCRRIEFDADPSHSRIAEIAKMAGATSRAIKEGTRIRYCMEV